MPLVRILVDGFSLLHHWPGLAPGRPRHSVAAREQLIRVLTAQADAGGVPITVVFDGGRTPAGLPPDPAPAGLEVLYTQEGQTADHLIERLTPLFLPYGDVLVVTNDHAEQDTVRALGGLVSDCETFIQTLAGTGADLSARVARHNRRERNRYRGSP